MGKGTKSQDSGEWKLDLGCASGGSQTPVQKSAAHQENYVKLQQASQKSNNSGLSRVWGGCGAASSRSECAHVCVRACARVRTCVCMCTCAHMCARMHVPVCASCVRARVCICACACVQHVCIMRACACAHCVCMRVHACVWGGSGARRAWNARTGRRAPCAGKAEGPGAKKASGSLPAAAAPPGAGAERVRCVAFSRESRAFEDFTV